MRPEPAALSALVDWFLAELPNVPALDLSAREYRRGWRSLEGRAYALVCDAADEWWHLYGIKLSDLWLSVAVFSAATVLGRLRVEGVLMTPPALPATPPPFSPGSGVNRLR